MTDTKIISAVVDPVEHPEQAASQVLLSLIDNGTFGVISAAKEMDFSNRLKLIHKELTGYFQTLKK